MSGELPPGLIAKFDQMFLTMTQEAGGLNPFLDCMFSFLQRRTDFYYEAEPGDRMGFPPGYPEQLVSRSHDPIFTLKISSTFQSCAVKARRLRSACKNAITKQLV